MRALVLVAALALAGCVAPLQQDVTIFHSPGSFEAALAAGGEVLGAREDPSVSGQTFPSIPLQVPELDAAWAPGRYALTSIHWWGPQGPPPPGDDDGSITLPSGWQGFMLSPHQMQVIPGAVGDTQLRRLGDQFLQNVTTLGPTARAAAVDALLADCNFMACTAPEPAAIDAAKAWRNAGGLGAVADETGSPSFAPSLSLQRMGSWWFHIAFDTATLTDGDGEGHTRTEVGSNDVVEFHWLSDRTHSDSRSFAKLEDVLARHGIQAPASADVQWTHQEVMYD